MSELARKVHLTNASGKIPENGGQILKSVLESEGFDLTKFTNANKGRKRRTENDADNIRRKKLKLIGGAVSHPTEITNSKLKEQLNQKIEQNEILIGEMIVPKTYKKLSLKNGKVSESTFITCGRKIPLIELKKKMFKKHEKYLREKIDYELLESTEIQNRLFNYTSSSVILNREESIEKLKPLQNTCHVMFWHDGSSIANHGYLVVTMNTLYDPT